MGRDEITEVIYESLLRRYSRILVGHPGVGKKALALQVLRRYSVHTGKPTYYINAPNDYVYDATRATCHGIPGSCHGQ
ncbi:MAG: ATP-binding protein [Chloroflexia bacterium]|nr:ATP-binding protein [Chloroflexia bacterium]